MHTTRLCKIADIQNFCTVSLVIQHRWGDFTWVLFAFTEQLYQLAQNKMKLWTQHNNLHIYAKFGSASLGFCKYSTILSIWSDSKVFSIQFDPDVWYSKPQSILL